MMGCTRLAGLVSSAVCDGIQPGGRPVALNALRMPVFALRTELDHVAPSQSVFKIHLLTDTDITVAPPDLGAPTAGYRIVGDAPGLYVRAE
jgi:hypothetical protein